MAGGQKEESRCVCVGRWRSTSAVLRLRRPADVAMMQATDFWNWEYHARARRLAWSSLGCVLVEREMSAGPVIVGEVAGQGAAQVSFAQDDDMIETLAADRADEPLREGLLPRAVPRREDFLDPHALASVPKLLAVDLVTVAQEIRGRGVVREGVHDLLGGPVGGGVLGHVEVNDAPAVVSEHDENKEDAQAHGWHREEIEGDEIADHGWRGTSAKSGRAGCAASGAAARRCVRPHRCRA